ncbi:MAG: hypothetical protein R2810_10885 [Flavobacteriales bacterium]
MTSAALTPASDAIIEAGALVCCRRPGWVGGRVASCSRAWASSLLYNVGGLSFAIAGKLTPLVAAILMPLSSVTVVAFVSLGSMVTARLLLPSTGTDINHVAR